LEHAKNDLLLPPSVCLLEGIRHSHLTSPDTDPAIQEAQLYPKEQSVTIRQIKKSSDKIYSVRLVIIAGV
jgi:hypothetical protein